MICNDYKCSNTGASKERCIGTDEHVEIQTLHNDTFGWTGKNK